MGESIDPYSSAKAINRKDVDFHRDWSFSMETQIYTFHISYKRGEDRIWRKVDVSSNYRLDKLGYLVLSIFDLETCQSFKFLCDGVCFSIPFEDDSRYPLDMTTFKLNQLNLREGALIRMDCSFGEGHNFFLEFVSCRNMTRGEGKRFPLVVDGAGFSNIAAFSLEEQTEKKGQAFQNSRPEPCCLFDIKAINASLKYNIDMIEERYAHLQC